MVENAFGILTSRFRIFQSPLPSSTGRLGGGGGGQRTVVLKGNGIPYEDCNAIGAAKRHKE